MSESAKCRIFAVPGARAGPTCADRSANAKNRRKRGFYSIDAAFLSIRYSGAPRAEPHASGIIIRRCRPIAGSGNTGSGSGFRADESRPIRLRGGAMPGASPPEHTRRFFGVALLPGSPRNTSFGSGFRADESRPMRLRGGALHRRFAAEACAPLFRTARNSQFIFGNDAKFCYILHRFSHMQNSGIIEIRLQFKPLHSRGYEDGTQIILGFDGDLRNGGNFLRRFGNFNPRRRRRKNLRCLRRRRLEMRRKRLSDLRRTKRMFGLGQNAIVPSKHGMQRSKKSLRR